MAYDLEIDERVIAYIESPGRLPRPAQVLVFRVLRAELEQDGDRFRQEGERLAPGSGCFWYDLRFDYLGQRYRLYVTVSDQAAQYGVLRAVYAEFR
ncbi:MAG TPA: hypothetical protein VFE78_17070 [Gemmataceae bacterium]|jgi:hypothetical protein|nr:hypothetical protein [Gemmataceae bacterium]